ncbi:MAG TPA: PKD domain-containing protein [Nocardioides sp.]|nr:PKD domain-containing protein [Nocardioides sp.]
MHVARTFRMAAAVAAATLVVGALGTGAAEAGKPRKPGSVTVSASATEPDFGHYDVAVTWTAATNATSYRASISRAGVTVASTTVTTRSWNPTVAAAPGQQLTVTVRGLAGHFKGKPGTKTLTLTDQLAPTGTYTSTFVTDAGTATITQDALSDDSPVSGVTRTVDWGDSSGPEAWPSGATLDHQYPLVEARYVPTVTLEDAAGHTTVVASTGVVVMDDTAPTGSDIVAPARAWAKLTKVTVTQTALADNWSPPSTITRRVTWGDGKTSAWIKGTKVTHVYAKGGTFTPSVTITDEAGNAATVSTSAVVVKVDKTGPKVTVARSRPKHSVKAWRKLHGRATDAGTGVKTVLLKAVEKRKGHWYGYNARTHRWVKAATKGKAFARSRALTRTTNSHHRWTAKLRGLRKGKLVVRAWATDRVGNHSATVTRKATLTRR